MQTKCHIGQVPKQILKRRIEMRAALTKRAAKATQSGFTIIELMMALVIVAILATLAIPAYQDYSIRARVAEGINLVAPVKLAMAESYLASNAFPTCDDFDDKCNSTVGVTQVTSENVSGIFAGPNGEIEVKYNVSAGSPLEEALSADSVGEGEDEKEVSKNTLRFVPILRKGATEGTNDNSGAGTGSVGWACLSGGSTTKVYDNSKLPPSGSSGKPAVSGTVPAQYVPRPCKL